MQSDIIAKSDGIESDYRIRWPKSSDVWINLTTRTVVFKSKNGIDDFMKYKCN